MNKTRLLSILVLIMVVLNLITVALLFTGRTDRGPHPRHGEIKEMISERLRFSDQQNEAYEDLIVEHRKSIYRMDEQMMAARNSLYSQLSGNGTTAIDSQLNMIGQVQKEIESVHYGHFADIRKLCTEEQIPAFNELTVDLATYFGVPKPPKRQH